MDPLGSPPDLCGNMIGYLLSGIVMTQDSLECESPREEATTICIKILPTGIIDSLVNDLETSLAESFPYIFG